MRLVVTALTALLVLGAGALCVTVAGDREELREAAREYFDAEMRGDAERVWNMLAPSSLFKKAYTLEIYKEMAKRSDVRIKAYNIEEIVEIDDNKDLEKAPNVRKIGVVRVKLLLSSPGFPDTEHHSTFVFLKEGARWYKG